MNWETYIAFGDSITIGARTYLGYPEFIGRILEQKTHKSWNVINHAVSGYTAIDLARSIDANIQNLKNSAPGVCTLLIGTNDVKANTHPHDFEIAINLLLGKIRLIAPAANIKTFDIPLFPKGVMYPYTIEMNLNIPFFFNAIEIFFKVAAGRAL